LKAKKAVKNIFISRMKAKKAVKNIFISRRIRKNKINVGEKIEAEKNIARTIATIKMIM
jgi:hypothetical protein